MWRFTLAKVARVKPTRGITEVVKVSGNNSSSFFLCTIASHYGVRQYYILFIGLVYISAVHGTFVRIIPLLS